MDIPSLRFRLNQIPDEPFTDQENRGVACCILDYASKKDPETQRYYIPDTELVYIMETFGFEIDFLKLTKRQLLHALTPQYSMASRYPELVYMLFRMLTEPAYLQQLLLAHPEVRYPVATK